MESITLSHGAEDILRRRLAGEWVEVSDETRPHYQELVRAGLAVPLHSFARGQEGAYRLTESATAPAAGRSSHAPSA